MVFIHTVRGQRTFGADEMYRQPFRYYPEADVLFVGPPGSHHEYIYDAVREWFDEHGIDFKDEIGTDIDGVVVERTNIPGYRNRVIVNEYPQNVPDAMVTRLRRAFRDLPIESGAAGCATT